MKSVRYAICCCAVLALATTAFAQDSKPEERFKFEAGYPTPEASEALYDEMDSRLDHLLYGAGVGVQPA